MGAGLSVGFAGISAGLAIGIVGDACVRGYVQEGRVRMRLRFPPIVYLFTDSFFFLLFLFFSRP